MKWWEYLEITELEQEAVERGLEQGMQQGIERGMQQGMQQGIERGMQQGMQQGIEQGIEQAKKIFRLYIDGKSMETIADICNLSLQHVQKILG